MKIAIHQPEFMPWLGFFHKMALADLYVVFDHVQFKKRYFENRNMIVSPKREIFYICTPVITKGRYKQAIKAVEIDNSQDWKNVLLNKLKHFYAKAPYFEVYYSKLSSLFKSKEHTSLMDFNMDMINFFRKQLGISTQLLFSSNMNVAEHKGSDLILQICRINKATTYLCGASGRDYLKEDDFLSLNIKIEWLNFISPVYGQLCDTFVPNMSILDLLFNNGENSLSIIMNANKKQENLNPCTY